MLEQIKDILLVEDDEIDVMSVKRAVKELKITNRLIIQSNGEEGLHYLNENTTHLPGIILLDINMPRMNGIELLKALKDHPKFKQIPVIMLTTSKEESDKIAAFSLGIAGYMIKPVDYQKFVEIIKTIMHYWTLSDKPIL